MNNQVVLSKIFGRRERVLFDVVTGEIKPTSQTQKIDGNFHIEAGHVYALYAEGGLLYVQRDTLRWPIDSPEVQMVYGHDLGKQTTSFTLCGHRIDYPAWWQGDPTFEPMEPERDEEEDYLAYLVSVWRQPELQRSLRAAWDGKAATG